VIALLQDRPAWYVLGPLIGLVVIGLLATINQRIGVLGGYSNVVERATGRTGELGWKAWFLFGVLGGGLLFRLLAGSSTVSDGYGWLTRTFDDPVAAAVLVLAGAAIGFGAKYAGGCTSGNGLGGTSFGSAASFVATGTFMAVAVGASFLLRAVT
jgi:uncharacterized membrane protein YedE/YeeE